MFECLFISQAVQQMIERRRISVCFLIQRENRNGRAKYYRLSA